MIANYQKRNFIKHLLRKYIKTDLTFEFLKEIYNDENLIDRVVFSTNMLTHYKYNISINNDKKHMLIRVNGRYNNNERMVKYIMRALKENNNAQVNLCFISSNQPFNDLLSTVCHDIDLVRETITNSTVDAVLREVEKKKILELIDEALDKGDREKFNELSKKYKELSE